MAKETIHEIIIKYHATVPFPLTVETITKAGYDPVKYLLNLLNEISACPEADTKRYERLIKNVTRLKEELEAIS